MREDASAEPADGAAHILVVDDDHRIRALIQRFLRKEGYRVSVAASAAEARNTLDGLLFDAVILDVMMPGEDGLSLLAYLKAEHPLPVLMLTARAEPDHRVEGLSRGADDYLGKPFDPRELALRLSNLIRARPDTSRRVRFGDFAFDLRREELTRDGEPVRLTDRERRLMRLLATRPNATIARQTLVADEDLGDRAIDVQINRLRRKLEDDPGAPRHLQTIRGQGYRLLADMEDE